MPNKPEQGRGHRRGRTFSRETNLQRNVATREEHWSVLIVTNGKSTEIDYFEALRQEPWITAHKVRTKFERGAPDAIVPRAARIRDESAYDEAWVVCDVDEFDVRTAVSAASTCDVCLALSVPSFEVWLILHLLEGCPGFNDATQAGVHLRKLLNSWSKTSLRYSDFSGGVFRAAARARRLAEPPDANPSTAVWRLIESLRAARESLRTPSSRQGSDRPPGPRRGGSLQNECALRHASRHTPENRSRRQALGSPRTFPRGMSRIPRRWPCTPQTSASPRSKPRTTRALPRSLTPACR